MRVSLGRLLSTSLLTPILFLLVSQAIAAPGVAGCFKKQADIILRQAALDTPAVLEFKQQHATFDGITSVDNKEYILLKDADLEGSKGRLYFDSENAILKELNDTIIGDKQSVDALVNAYRKMFLKNLMSDPVLSNEVIAKYADYKSVRLILKKSSPDIEKRLLEMHRKTSLEFGLLVEKTPFKSLYSAGHGIATNPDSWHLAGFGSSADESNVAARYARKIFDPAQPFTAAQHFSDARPYLIEELKQIETIRQKLQQRISTRSGILVLSRANRNQAVLSEDAIELLRKVEARNLNDYISSVREKFKKRFKVTLSDEDIILVRDYYKSSDSFSPGLYAERRVQINLGAANSGLISVDFAGQGARNARHLMEALAEKAGGDPKEAMAAARHAYDLASETMALTKGEIIGLSQRTPKVRAGGKFFSGDDGVLMPTSALSGDEKIKLVASFAETPETVRVRLTFVPSNYSNGSTIPSQMRSQLIVLAETAEKSARSALEGVISIEKQRQVMIAVDLVPDATGSGKINFIVGGQIDEQTAKALQVAAKKAVPQGYHLGEIHFSPLIKKKADRGYLDQPSNIRSKNEYYLITNIGVKGITNPSNFVLMAVTGTSATAPRDF